MKRSILTLFSIVYWCCSFAQPGITAGINIAKYTYAESKFDVHRKSLLACNFGVNYKQMLGSKIILLPELSYSVKGSRVYYDYPIGFTGPMKNVNTFKYVQVRLPAIIALPIGDDINYEIGAGLFAAYLIKATQKTVEFDGNSLTRDFNAGQIKKMDIGLHFSTGFRMGGKLGLHFNYDLGLSNMQGVDNDPRMKTRCFSINISWIFAKS